MKILLGSVLVAVQALAAPVENGGFENPFGREFWGGSFGGGPGGIERSEVRPHSGKWCCRVFKERGPGGAQLMGSLELDDAQPKMLSFWYRGGGTAAWSLQKRDGKKLVPVKNPLGISVSSRRSLPKTADWTRVEMKVDIPAGTESAGLCLSLQFQCWGKGELFLDDLELGREPSPGTAIPRAAAPVEVTVKRPEPSVGYGPIPGKAPFAWGMGNGVFTKDGKAHFFLGNGCDLGSAQSTPAGMWLAKAQGVEFLALESGTRQNIAEMRAKLDVASAIALEDVRNRRGGVAQLYGYLGGFGLPVPSDGDVSPELSWFTAAMMAGWRPDVMGERYFAENVDPAKWPLLVVADQRIVRDETYGAFKRYVERGGTALVTTNSLARTFTRYAATDIATWSAGAAADGRIGKGRLVLVPSMASPLEAGKTMAPYLPKPEVEISGSIPRC